MLAYIYKITNLVNSKCYIGFTQLGVDNRWKAHCRDYLRKNYKLYKAMRKYGVENFSIEEIYCSTDLIYTQNVVEPLLIAEYGTFKKGYNANLGGNRQVFSMETRQKMSRSRLGKSINQRRDYDKYPIKISDKQKEIYRHLYSKKWLVIYPDGKEELVEHLKTFCTDNQINYYSLLSTAPHRKNPSPSCYGFKCELVG